MRLILVLLFLPLAALGQSFTVLVNSNGVIRYPTNFFQANSNAMVAVTGTGGGGGSVASTDITDSTAAGRALLTAVDAAAQRTALSLGTSALLSVATSGNAASGEVVKGDDTRLTDSRTPSAHSHDAGAITSGVLSVARLATGTPHGSNFLRGDGQFAQVTTNDIPGLVAALAAGGGGGGTTNLVDASAAGLAPQATLPNAYLGTDASTNVAWRLGPLVAGGQTIVSNTVTETTIFETTIPANTLTSDGDGLSWILSGIVLNDSGAGRTIVIKVLIDGVTVYQDTTDSITASSTKRALNISGYLFRSSSTLAQGGALFSFGAGAATTGVGDIGGAALRGTTFGWEDAAATWSSGVTFKVTYTFSAASTAFWAKTSWRISR